MEKINKFLIIVFICFFLISGCDVFKKKPIDLTKIPVGQQQIKEGVGESKEIVSKSEDQVGKSTKIIEEEAKEIKGHTQTAEEKLSEENKPKVIPILQKIDTNADNILDENEKLKFVEGQLSLAVNRLGKTEDVVKDYSKTIGKLENEYKEVVKERDSLKKAAESKTAALMRWLILFSIAGIGGSGALLFYGNKLGLVGIIACGITLIVAIAVSQHIILISWIGIGIIVIISGILVWQIWLHKKAVSEIVKTTEVTKVELSPVSNKRVFGDGINKGLAGSIQSKSTENIVSKERQKLDKIWDYAKKKAEETLFPFENSIEPLKEERNFVTNGNRKRIVIT